MKIIKTLLFAQIIILLISCSTNNFYTRKYTKGRYIESTSNYTQKPSKVKNEQYTYNTKKEENKTTQNKKKNTIKKSVVVEEKSTIETREKINTKAINKKLKPIRKLAQKTASIPITSIKKSNKIKKFANTLKSQKEDSPTKADSYKKLCLTFLLAFLVLLTISILIVLILDSYVAFFIGLLITIFSVISLITSFVFLLLWLVNL